MGRLEAAAGMVVEQYGRSWRCCRCGAGGPMRLIQASGALCLACAGLAGHVLLRPGDATLTRRATAESRLSAVVVRFRRGRLGRAGVLVDPDALSRARRRCLADSESRTRRRERDGQVRRESDRTLVAAMTEAIRRAFPGCPPERALRIAEHTAERGSGRVGRSAGGRALDPDKLRLAVVASVRHHETRYDALRDQGVGRLQARRAVSAEIERVLERWRRAPSAGPRAEAPVAQCADGRA